MNSTLMSMIVFTIRQTGLKMMTTTLVLNPSYHDSWLYNVGHNSMPSYSGICKKGKKSTFV